MSDTQLAILESAITIETLIKQRNLIERAMSSVMKPEIHYGQIPGSKQPSLYKPGAQILCTLFRLRPEYAVEERELDGGHKRFKVLCKLFITGTDPAIPVAEGWGEASSMESKHRFRNNFSANLEFTEDEPPGMYWNMKRNEGVEAANAWLSSAYAGKKVRVAKNDKDFWRVAFVTGEPAKKAENENIADVWNTVLKMACKRAYVEATITATASNDFFTQDLEDIARNLEEFRREEAERVEGGDGGAGTGKAAKVTKSWEMAVNHIGKKGGPVYGKKLGDLDDGQRQWLFDTITEKGARAGKQDKMLLKALEEWRASKAATGEKPAGGAKKETPAAEGNAGVNKEILAQNLDWAGIPNEVFVAVVNGLKLSAAESFEAVTDAEAAEIMNQLEAVTDECRARMNATK